MDIGVQLHLLVLALIQSRLNRLYLLVIVIVDSDETFVELPQFDLLHRKLLLILRILAQRFLFFLSCILTMVLSGVASQYCARAAIWDLYQGFLQKVLFEVGRSLNLLHFVPLVQPKTIARARSERLWRVELLELRLCLSGRDLVIHVIGYVSILLQDQPLLILLNAVLFDRNDSLI